MGGIVVCERYWARAEHDWHTLAIGFFLGRGFNGDDSHELALELLRRNML